MNEQYYVAVKEIHTNDSRYETAFFCWQKNGSPSPDFHRIEKLGEHIAKSMIEKATFHLDSELTRQVITTDNTHIDASTRRKTGKDAYICEVSLVRPLSAKELSDLAMDIARHIA